MVVQKATEKPAKSEHPKYVEMIVGAIEAKKERKGSSRQAIHKHIVETHKLPGDQVSTHLKLALKRAVVNGTIVQVKGTGASGSFKLPAVEKKAKKKTEKPKTTAKPKGKEAKASATSKKPKAAGKKGTPNKKSAAKKSTKKPTKSPAKKPVKGKASTKKATKKPSTKKPAKKATKKAAAKKN